MWQFLSTDVRTVETAAQTCEQDGWDGLVLTDSQNLSPDPYVSLALAAKCTRTLRLGTGVTNPVTRHAAVTANVIASLQEISAGRMVLGIGRGDSALFNIGRRPANIKDFEQYVSQIQTYLSGETTVLNDYPSRLRWLDSSSQPKVPVDVTGTGPKVLAIAARHADWVSFAMGVDVKRLGSGIEHVLNALPAKRPRPKFSAYVNVCVTDNHSEGVEMIRSGVATFAHFSGMRGGVETLPSSDKAVFKNIDAGYDHENHGRSRSAHAQNLPIDFIHRFALVGDHVHVTDRLFEILQLGIQRLIIIGPNLAEFPEAAATARRKFVEYVLPKFAH